MKVIGVAGYARAGKDTFTTIAIDILSKNGFHTKQYSFAEQLKNEVNPFLSKTCRVSAWTSDPEEKKDIRDFLVWYGTTFWRKRDPKRWIRGVDNQLKLDGNDVDIAIVSDVRYPNECEWVHSWSGYVVHVAAYKFKEKIVIPQISSDDDGSEGFVEDIVQEKVFFDAPNEQERINDPIVKSQSDYKLEWEAKGLGPKEAVEHPELRAEVLKALNSIEWFTDALIL